MKLNKLIKIIMIEQEMSAVDLAKRAGLSRSTIYTTVGDCGNPTLTNLTSIAIALGTDLGSLITRAQKLENDLQLEKDNKNEK